MATNRIGETRRIVGRAEKSMRLCIFEDKTKGEKRKMHHSVIELKGSQMHNKDDFILCRVAMPEVNIFLGQLIACNHSKKKQEPKKPFR